MLVSQSVLIRLLRDDVYYPDYEAMWQNPSIPKVANQGPTINAKEARQVERTLIVIPSRPGYFSFGILFRIVLSSLLEGRHSISSLYACVTMVVVSMNSSLVATWDSTLLPCEWNSLLWNLLTFYRISSSSSRLFPMSVMSTFLASCSYFAFSKATKTLSGSSHVPNHFTRERL